MEALTEIERFLFEVDRCFCDGDGSGSGSGSGYGYGYGYGDGYGYGSGIKAFCGEAVYLIDGIQTIIRKLKGNIAKGVILNSDLTTTPCYVVKQNGMFAHGETLREAQEALVDKLFEGMSEDQRINAFIEAHPLGKKYPNQDLYDWHHKLTGSCDMGRKTFAKEHGIDMDSSMTVGEFIDLTRDAYGGSTIRKLEARYKEMKK